MREPSTIVDQAAPGYSLYTAHRDDSSLCAREREKSSDLGEAALYYKHLPTSIVAQGYSSGRGDQCGRRRARNEGFKLSFRRLFRQLYNTALITLELLSTRSPSVFWVALGINKQGVDRSVRPRKITASMDQRCIASIYRAGYPEFLVISREAPPPRLRKSYAPIAAPVESKC